jgi:hypothetical protein
VAGGWRRLHNEELRNLYASPDIIRVIKSRRMKWVVHVARMGDMKNDIWVVKREGKRQLGKPSHRCEDNIRMDVKKIEWESMD